MLTADARVRTLFLASDMLAKQLHALRLPDAAADQVLPLLDLIQHHAQALSGQEASPALRQDQSSNEQSGFASNVVPFRRH